MKEHSETRRTRFEEGEHCLIDRKGDGHHFQRILWCNLYHLEKGKTVTGVYWTDSMWDCEKKPDTFCEESLTLPLWQWAMRHCHNQVDWNGILRTDWRRPSSVSQLEKITCSTEILAEWRIYSCHKSLLLQLKRKRILLMVLSILRIAESRV